MINTPWRQLSNTIHVMWMKFMPTGCIELNSREEIFFLSNEFGGEAGELQNVIKKIGCRGRTPELMAKLRDEMGDVRIMLHHIEEVFGVDAEECAEEKTEKNLDRDDWPFKVPWTPTANRRVFWGVSYD